MCRSYWFQLLRRLWCYSSTGLPQVQASLWARSGRLQCKGSEVSADRSKAYSLARRRRVSCSVGNSRGSPVWSVSPTERCNKQGSDGIGWSSLFRSLCLSPHILPAAHASLECIPNARASGGHTSCGMLPLKKLCCSQRT